MTDWDDIANQAAKATDEQLANQIASLSQLNDTEIQKIVQQTGISKKDMQKILKVVNDASLSNEEKANSIKNIGNGINILAAIAKKLL
ncbi:hypothetical protein [Alistipes sp. ZOR0009]|uniref:hypothetical protein n=1 Tax=Alistipes sp. ZOR0009 TaxID=1339253 RepID=UPI0006484DC3|nr:hypothetical protein [Alistipes sp. ZOR0009]